MLKLARLTAVAACATLAACSATPPQSIPAAGAGNGSRPARNVILFIGDGMGVSTVTAARIYDGQSRGAPGEENLLSFEQFPHLALVKTYNTNQQVPDSAGTASAINSGTKTRAGVINIAPSAARGDCEASLGSHLAPLAYDLLERAMSVGIVSTARLTHATPAAVYAFSPERDWENDAEIPPDQRTAGCVDIAAQLEDFPFEVALGGGLAQFYGSTNGGRRLDAEADLPAAWTAQTGGHFVTTRSAMRDAPQDGRPLFGLFSPSHMTYMLDRTEDSAEPTLSEMTAAAIERLSGDPDGFFLMVEGGRIDHGHHDGRAGYALAETQEFAHAIAVAQEMVDLDETLILVTADHSHVFTIAGYPTRGNPILGLVQGNDAHGEPSGELALAADGMPYTTLGYMNGPGAITGGARPAPEQGESAHQQAAIPLSSESHAGEDVPLYATGPGSERVHGVIEQNVIHDIVLEALR